MFSFHRHKRPPGPSYFAMADHAPRDRLQLAECLARYGDLVKIPSLSPIYLLNHPLAIRDVLVTKADHYLKGGAPLRRIEEALGQGLLTNQGEKWRRSRHVIQPWFQEKQCLRFLPLFHQLTQTMLDRWERDYVATQQPFDIAHEMMALVLQITAHALFNMPLGEHTETILRLIHLGNRHASYATIIAKWWPSLSNWRYRRGKHALHTLLQQLIQQHHAQPPKEPDLLTALSQLRYSEEGPLLSATELLDEFKTLLVTGHETTGSALGWAWYCLLQHPADFTQMQREVDQVYAKQPVHADSLTELKFTRAVFAETLRLYPPIWLTGRTAQHTDQLLEYPIPAKSSLLICPYTLHRHATWWDAPQEFHPQRFLQQDKTMHGMPLRYRYIPFGLGPRICIGSGLANLQAQFILASVAQRFHLQLVPKQKVSAEPLISLKPKPSVMVMALRR